MKDQGYDFDYIFDWTKTPLVKERQATMQSTQATVEKLLPNVNNTE
jgi:hypothetical protein